jgi:nucleoid-associated protein YgaU
VTAAWLAPAAGGSPGRRPVAGGLRLVGDPRSALPDEDDEWGAGWSGGVPLTSVPDRRPIRRTSPVVRRRRVLLAAMGLLLVALALPLSGTGGNSHPIGSALAETGHPVSYTVQPGDTLWSIAGRVDPAGDPRPLVARLAAQIGSDTVVPGEHLVLP